MNKRREIIDFLNHPAQPFEGLYGELKRCLILNTKSQNKIDDIDAWFGGIIESLYYLPNYRALILEGHAGIGKTRFFADLLPKSEWYSETRARYSDIPDIYSNLIVNMSDFSITQMKRAACSSAFAYRGPEEGADKKLASICYTTNVVRKDMLGRRRTIVLTLDDIDKERFNAINKHKLWVEIYNRYVEKMLFNK